MPENSYCGKTKKKRVYCLRYTLNEQRSEKCQKFCVSPITNRVTTASAIALTQKNVTEENLDIDNMQPLNIQNLSNKNNNTNKFILGFSYDKYLNRFWNDPLKYIPRLQSAHAVATPDFTIDPQMNFSDYLHQVHKNRWLGCLWQSYGILTLPTVGWTTAEWDYLSFCGIEHGSIVVISTLGSKRNIEYFMRGYTEMIKRIEPPLIVVYGDVLPNMTGRFVNFPYKESFQTKKSPCVQIDLFNMSRIFEIKE